MRFILILLFLKYSNPAFHFHMYQKRMNPYESPISSYVPPLFPHLGEIYPQPAGAGPTVLSDM